MLSSAEPCADDEFQCPDDGYGRCYPLTYLCDSVTDCSSGWDEQDCSSGMYTLCLLTVHIIK